MSEIFVRMEGGKNCLRIMFNPYPTVFPYGNGMVLHFYQQQESSTTKTVHNIFPLLKIQPGQWLSDRSTH